MYRAAVVGDYDSIYGFAALGLSVFPAADAAECAAVLRSLAAGDEYAVIFITEGMAAQAEEEIAKYRGRLLPAIILIPGVSGNTGEGIAQVKRQVEKAVGSDIVFNDAG